MASIATKCTDTKCLSRSSRSIRIRLLRTHVPKINPLPIAIPRMAFLIALRRMSKGFLTEIRDIGRLYVRGDRRWRDLAWERAGVRPRQRETAGIRRSGGSDDSPCGKIRGEPGRFGNSHAFGRERRWHGKLPETRHLLPMAFESLPLPFEFLPVAFEKLPEACESLPEALESLSQAFESLPQAFEKLPKAWLISLASHGLGDQISPLLVG